MKTATQMFETVGEMSRKLGPYVLLELLLPGGTLFALTLFLYRHPSVLKRYTAAARRNASRFYSKTRRAADRSRRLATRRALARRASKARALGSDLYSTMRALG